MPTAQLELETQLEPAQITQRAKDWSNTKDSPPSWRESRSQHSGEYRNLDISQDLNAEIERATRILELEDDWDGEGSSGYTEDTFNRAVEFLTEHSKGLWELCGSLLPVPRIGPGPDGSIDLHWKLPSHELLVNIPSDPNEVPTFYGDNYGALKNRGTLEPKKFNAEIVPWLMN